MKTTKEQRTIHAELARTNIHFAIGGRQLVDMIDDIDTLETRLSEATALLERAKTDVECMRTRYKEEEDRISCAVWLADLEKFNKENGK